MGKLLLISHGGKVSTPDFHPFIPVPSLHPEDAVTCHPPLLQFPFLGCSLVVIERGGNLSFLKCDKSIVLGLTNRPSNGCSLTVQSYSFPCHSKNPILFPVLHDMVRGTWMWKGRILSLIPPSAHDHHWVSSDLCHLFSWCRSKEMEVVCMLTGWEGNNIWCNLLTSGPTSSCLLNALGHPKSSHFPDLLVSVALLFPTCLSAICGQGPESCCSMHFQIQ